MGPRLHLHTTRDTVTLRFSNQLPGRGLVPFFTQNVPCLEFPFMPLGSTVHSCHDIAISPLLSIKTLARPTLKPGYGTALLGLNAL